VTLELARVEGAWRVSSQPTLRLVSGCYVHGVLTESCPKNARVALFSIGRLKPGGGVNGQQLVPVPPAVEDAGGRELSEFNAGMKVVAQTGCFGVPSDRRAGQLWSWSGSDECRLEAVWGADRTHDSRPDRADAVV
jgi:hypothetical protein